jgi:hypothetical protein
MGISLRLPAVWLGSVVAIASIAFPATALAHTNPRQASTAPTITLSAASGPVGTSLTVSGAGFPPTTPFAVYMDIPDQTMTSSRARFNTTFQTDGQGALLTYVDMSPGTYGQHSVCADTSFPGSTSPKSVKACAPFAIQASVFLDLSSGPAGARVQIGGNGFPAGEIVALYFDDTGHRLSTPGPPANGLGTFDVQPFDVPSFVAAGAHSVCGDTGAASIPQPVVVKACAAFEVVAVTAQPPKITVSVSYGDQVELLALSGTGFPPYSTMSGFIDGKELSLGLVSRFGLGSDSHGVIQWNTVWLPYEYYTPYGTVPLSNGPHVFCVLVTKSTDKVCAQFEIQGGPPPATPTSSPSPSARPVAIAARNTANRLPASVPLIGLAILILLALGAVAWVKFSRSRSRGI